MKARDLIAALSAIEPDAEVLARTPHSSFTFDIDTVEFHDLRFEGKWDAMLVVKEVARAGVR